MINFSVKSLSFSYIPWIFFLLNVFILLLVTKGKKRVLLVQEDLSLCQQLKVKLTMFVHKPVKSGYFAYSHLRQLYPHCDPSSKDQWLGLSGKWHHLLDKLRTKTKKTGICFSYTINILRPSIIPHPHLKYFSVILIARKCLNVISIVTVNLL